MKKVEVKRNYELLKETITPNNVLAISELIAISQTKYLSSVMGNDLLRIHHELYRDLISLKGAKHTFSEGYDLVQECALVLCQNFGKRLTDIMYYTKKNKPVTLKKLCQKAITKVISQRYSKCRRTLDIDNLPFELQPVSTLTENKQEDFAKVDEMIETMQLTENHIILLNCRMAGLSFPEIGRVLNKCTGTIYDLYCTIRRRYAKYYGNTI